MTLPASGPLSLSDIQGEFGGTAPTSLSEYYAGGTYVSTGTNGTYGPVPSTGAISVRDFYGTSNAFLPTGMIIPYNSTAAIPTGFTQFTAANDRSIIGAGSSYAVGATGGSSSMSISGTTTTQGGHIGPGATATYSYQAGTNAHNTDVNTRGDHNHTYSGSATITTPIRRTRLIKATQNITQLPAGAALLKHTAGAFTGLSRVTGIAGYNLHAHTSALDIAGSSTATVSVSTSTSGAHAAHHTLQGSPYAYYASPALSSGGHTHTSSFTGTVNPPYRYMALYQAATANIAVPAQNIIGMWESTTPPAGWVVCDGANGTPDLRNYFIKFLDNDTGINTTGGSSTVSLSGTFSATGNHNHGDTNRGSIFTFTGYHQNNFEMATHTGSASVSFTPPYYALIFVMRA